MPTDSSQLCFSLVQFYPEFSSRCSVDTLPESVALRVFWGIGILIERSVSLGSAHTLPHIQLATLTVGVLFKLLLLPAVTAHLQATLEPTSTPPLPFHATSDFISVTGVVSNIFSLLLLFHIFTI